MGPTKRTSGSGSNRGITDHAASELLLHACHDLRAHLRGVRTAAELLVRDQQRGASIDVAQRLGLILDGTQRLDRLIDSLAEYGIALQTERGAFVSVPMEPLLRTALARLDSQLREHGAEVSYDRLPRVPGDPDRLMQLFDHLLRNALQHRGAIAPRVHVSAEECGQGWVFKVADNGPGMDPADLETIFQPFQHLAGSGVGMGLAICHAVVERHGGRMWAECPEGGGNSFFFVLPTE